MSEVFGILCTLSLLLAVVAVVGHLLWLAVAGLFRALSGNGRQVPRRPGTHCPECAVPLEVVANRCAKCGCLLHQSQTASLESDLRAAERQLNRLFRAGSISQHRLHELLEAVHAEQQRLEAERGDRLAAGVTPKHVSRAVQPAQPSEERPVAAESVGKEALEIEEFVEPVVEEPPAPRRSLADLLQAFMEEKNIRWGELVSGLLIIVSSIGLVISLWSSLKEAIPYFPALLFMLVTAAIHAAGVYTLKKWKLESTSRGLLLISLLLIPLNFLAAIALSEESGESARRAVKDPLYLAAVTVGLLGYGAIAFSSSRLLFVRRWPAAWLAVMGPSIGQLIISRIAEPGLPNSMLMLLDLLPLASFLAAVGWLIVSNSRSRELDNDQVSQSFLLTGVAAFSFLMPIGLFVANTDSFRLTLAGLSPCMSLAAAGLLGVGLVIHKRVSVAATRTAGTAVALIGASLMLISLVLAWPQPDLFLILGIVDFVALAVLALAADLALLHTAAVSAAALAAVVGFHLWQGNLSPGVADGGRKLSQVLLMGRSGVVLAGVSLLAGGVGAVCGRFSGRLSSAKVPYLVSAAGVGLVSILVALYAGFAPAGADAELAAPIFALYGVIALLVAPRLQHRAVSLSGSGLLLLGVLHALNLNEIVIGFLALHDLLPGRPVVTAVLLHGSMTALILLLTFFRRFDSLPGDKPGTPLWEAFGFPLAYSSLFAMTVVLPGLVFVEEGRFAAQCGYTFWGAGLWLVFAWMLRSRLLFAAGQALGTLGVVFTVTAVCRRADWWSDESLDPRHLQAQLSSLAGWSMLWTGLRLGVTRRAEDNQLCKSISNLFPARWPAVDRIVLGVVVIGLVALGLAGAVPGINAELGTASVVWELLSFDSLVGIILVLLTIGLLWTLSRTLTGGFQAVGVLAGVGVVVALFWFLTEIHFADLRGAADVSHSLAYGGGTWIALAVTTVALLVSLRERFSSITLAGLTVIGFVVPLLIAGPAEEQFAAASAFRWSLAGYWLIVSLLLAGRNRLGSAAGKLGVAVPAAHRGAATVRYLSLGLTVVPILALTFRFALAAMGGNAVFRPVDESLFARLGPAVGYAGPLVLLAAACLVNAVRERQPLFSYAGSLAVQLGVGLGYLLPLRLANAPVRFTELVELLLWLSVGLAVYSLGWLTARRWLDPEVDEEAVTARTPLGVHLAQAASLIGGLGVLAVLMIIFLPDDLPAALQSIGSRLGYGALGLTLLAWLGYLRPALRETYQSLSAADPVQPTLTAEATPARQVIDVFAGFGLALAVWIACSTVDSNTAGNWFTFHALTAGWSVLAVLLVTGVGLSVYRGFSSGEHLVSRATLVGGLVLLLCFRSVWEDPLRPWWSMGPAAAMALSAGAVALFRRSQPYAFLSIFVAMLAATFVWLRPWIGIGDPASVQSPAALLEANLTTAALVGLLWLGVEIFYQRRRGVSLDLESTIPAVHHAAATAGLVIAAVPTVIIMILRSHSSPAAATELPVLFNTGGSLTYCSLGLLIIASLWDRTAKHAILCLYGWGLLGLALFLDGRALEPRMLAFWIGAALAGYVTVAGVLWFRRKPIRMHCERVGVPPASVEAGLVEKWLPAAQTVLAGIVTVIEIWVVLTFAERPLRLWGTLAAAVMIPGFVCLAHESSRTWLRGVALLLGALAAADFGWALMNVSAKPDFWLQRTIRLMEMLSVVTFVYGVGLVRLLREEGVWFRTVRTAAALCGFVALLALILVLGMEAAWFDPVEGAPITDLQTAVVAVVLVGLAAALISLAVLPGSDPLNLSEKGRMVYVYAAEVVLSLLFLHVYLTKPMWFSGFLLPYWPYIVMAIAYFGAGTAEYFQRRNFRVLAEPLHRTGAFLPLLPAIGFWVHSAQAGPDILRGEYSTLLFVVGLLYVFLSMWRKTFVYGVAAALAGNAGLWALWSEQGWSLLNQPQLWMIPPALSVLVAAQVNRDRLSGGQLTTVRYFCITLIYVSSTGDMFIKGVGENIWMPMLLALFSVAGVFAGILLRIRAFLYLGSSFLLLSLVCMVWHAQQQIGHTWPWWAFGIALGLAILTLFGLFEKKRNEVLHVFDTLKRWES